MTPDAKPWYQRRGIWLAGALVVLFILALSGNRGNQAIDNVARESDQSSGAGEFSDDSIEYKLAVVDEGGFVETSDSRIGTYGVALDRLEGKCGDSRTMLADMAVRSTQLLADEGVAATALEMLHAADQSIPAEAAPKDGCSDIFATLIVLMTE